MYVWIEGSAGECEDERVNEVSFFFVSYEQRKEDKAI